METALDNRDGDRDLCRLLSRLCGALDHRRWLNFDLRQILMLLRERTRLKIG
jgi:hypothetical protein